MSDRLLAWWGDALVGELTVREDVLQFRYDPSARRAISRSLPLGGEWQPGRFFSNLLPDGALREQLARRLGVSVGNDFALLQKLGGDCAGALALLDDGISPASLLEGREPLSPKRLIELTRGTVVNALASGRVRLSLAGAQEKLPVVVDGKALFLPTGRAASTHILKLPRKDLPNLAVNELFMLELARSVGLPTVEARLWPIEAEHGLLVTRFDRKDGQRLHQEDLCQATDRPPTRKYEEEGGPAFPEIVEVIRSESREPAIDVDVALRWLAFNVLAGNADGHAKNLGFLRDDAVRLAPVYDLVCTRQWPAFGSEVAIGVAGQRDPGRIDASRWTALAKDAGLGPKFVASRIAAMANDLPKRARELAVAWKDRGIDLPPVNAIPLVIARLCRRALVLLKPL